MDVQKSRFAALYIDQDSDSDDEAGWEVLAPTKYKYKPLNRGGSGTTVAGHHDDGKGLSKNAKKRARKRRNKSTSSDQCPNDQNEVQSEAKPDSTQDNQDEDIWMKKNEEAAEEEFHKKLREALIQSTIEAKKMSKDVKVTEERTSALSNKPTKKTVKKLSLQELHKMVPLPPAPPAPPPPPPPQTSSSSSVQAASHIMPPGIDPHQVLNQLDDPFLYSPIKGSPFSPLLEDVEAEIKKEMTRDKRPNVSTEKHSLSEEDRSSMLPRIAQLEDRLEKKDKIIAKLKKEYALLKKTLTEVKERNQSLCTIMSQGEFSKKAELLKEVNELSAVKDDLTVEVETLSSGLEQERSKNKALRAELTKLQNSHVKTSKHSSH